jgi:5-methylcytosine-specific restriction protein A
VPIRQELAAVLEAVPTARAESLKDHPFARRLKGPAALAVENVVSDPLYKVEGSPGKGVWAETVWISVFDRMVTESAQEGFYVVYLFRRDGSGAYLSLNQGTTAILNQAGRTRYLQVLRDTAARDVGILSAEDTEGLLTGPIDLDGTTALTRGYEAGSIFARHYDGDELPSEAELETDLTQFLLLYQALVEGRANVGADEPPPADAPLTGVEARRFRWHRRAERSRALARRAKQIHGTRCQVCDVQLTDVYGPVAEGYIEAHHLTPFAELDGRPTDLDPQADFAVVCPTCHRMLHLGPPYTLGQLRAMLTAVTAPPSP